MNRMENALYAQDIASAAKQDLPWEELREKTIVISGATGLIGCCLIDTLAYRSLRDHLNCTIYALTRDPERAASRATPLWASCVRFVQCDINRQRPEIPEHADYVIHAASNTHPVAYATDPIGTILTNILGTQNMLELAADHGAERSLFLSSVEIYGENRGDCERYDETYCGYIDCNTLRAGYPESKRAGEALCQAYIRQKRLDIVIEVNEHILDNPMYDPMFSVEEVNRLAAAGMPFRDAYKKVGLDIEAGKFKADKHIHHTHEGSIGNLCNDEIQQLMQQTLDGFHFERMTEAERALLGR